MIYLLDTNIVVYTMRGLKVRKSPTTQQRECHRVALRILERARKQKNAGDEIALSAITVAELEFGAWCSGNYPAELDAIRRAIIPLVHLPFDADSCATRYGEIRYKLECTGKPIGSFDMLIAAHALALGAILVTNNMAQFARVPELQCEDWAI